ncbi:hypothetical protein BGW38_002015 [Lunasporangiospora selenospora]|uniref:Autophagy-related protein 14 n=1 Tax=Lunasporangiospora selenospora TaxID=979761 RepID=A0A9P6KDU2_9FUNG|nr:hypothetical protein BGW38_002015 [Lunasporangiospora selenospora]
MRGVWGRGNVDRLHQHWDDIRNATAYRDRLSTQVNQVLNPNLKRYQMCLAQRAMAVDHNETIAEEKRLLLSELEQDRQQLARLRAGLNQRRETLKLSQARFQVAKMGNPQTITHSINRINDRWASVHQKLAHSRLVLVEELVTLFDLKHLPERRRQPPLLDANLSDTDQTSTILGGSNSSTSQPQKRATKLRVRDYLDEDSWNEYVIVGRPLPTGYFENYDRDEINTTIENVIHMMTLVACYLGIKLPFETFTRQSRYYIQASFTPSSKRAPLFLSENNLTSFAAGLGHLNYNIAYLCHSQGVYVTLAKAANTLENLLACCQAPNLGRYTNYTTMIAVKAETREKGVLEGTMTQEKSGRRLPSVGGHEMMLGHAEELGIPTTTISPPSDDGDFEKIIESDIRFGGYRRSSNRRSDKQESLLWCPGQEPFVLDVQELVTLIRSRREEEAPVWGGLQLQDAVAAAHLDSMDEDYFLHDDQEEEDGMYTLGADANAESGNSSSSSTSSNGNSSSLAAAGGGSARRDRDRDRDQTPSTGTSSAVLGLTSQRRPPHPGRDRRSSRLSEDLDGGGVSNKDNSSTGSSNGANTRHTHLSEPSTPRQPENWTFLDVDTVRVPSTISHGPGHGLLAGRGWPDMTMLKQLGTAVGGAAVGLVNNATSVAMHRVQGSASGSSGNGGTTAATHDRKRSGRTSYSADGRFYPAISSSAP